MHDQVKEAFDGVRASDRLKASTLALLRNRISGGPISLDRLRKRKNMRIFAAAAACFVLLCGAGGGYLYGTEAAAISVDVNPSVELGLNPFNRVISVTPFDPDGAALIEGLPLKGRSYEQAVEDLLEKGEAEGYIRPSSLVSLTVQTGDAQRESRMLKSLRGMQQATHARVDCHSVTAGLREQAHSCGMSAGKYRAAAELQALGGAASPEDCRDWTMRDIQEHIDACHSGGAGSGSTGGGCGNGGHHHGGHG